jgi:trigger factor
LTHFKRERKAQKVEMNVSVVDVSASQKKLQVEIPASKVQKELDSRYRELANQARIKGFRPGKVPRSILKSYYGKSVESEVSNQFIQDTFADALRQSELKPLVEADVNEMHFEDNGSFTYTATVDVSPPFEVPDYKGISVSRSLVEVRDEQPQSELQKLREQHGELRALEVDRPVQEGDTVVIDFTPWTEGAVFEKGKTSDYMLEVGKKTLHPDFDQHLIGREKGESFSFELDYPDEAPTPEIAGKRVRFEVTIKELKELILPDLDDDFARKLGEHESLQGLTDSISDKLVKQQEGRVSTEVRQQIIDQLVERTELELSNKVIEKEIDHMIRLLQHQFESQGLKVDPDRFNTPEIRAEYRPQAEKNLRWRLISSRIAELEEISLNEAEMEEIYTEIARLFRTDLDKVRSDYADSTIVDQTKSNKIQDKVLQFLEDEAVTEEAAETGESSQQE